MLKEGMKIEIFPDTDVSAYKRWIKDEGFSCKACKTCIIIGKQTRYVTDREEFARVIRKARIKANLKRADVAKTLGVREDTVYSWEIGRQMPREETFKTYCKILKLNAKEVMKDCRTIKR